MIVLIEKKNKYFSKKGIIEFNQLLNKKNAMIFTKK